MSKLNYEHVFNTLVEETAKYITKNNLKAMVLGISGGIDSTVVAAICHEVSKKTGIPLIGRSLPIKNKSDEFDVSKLVGEAFCDEFKVFNLSSSYKSVLFDLCADTGLIKDCKGYDWYWVSDLEELAGRTPIANGNIQARCRMIHLYDIASIRKGLVMSTDNQTEYQLGFWTIHGDVGDFDPIQGLWKTEVYELAKWLIGYYYGCGIKKEVDADGARKICDMCEAIKKSMSLTPTDGLGISNSDLDQIGAKSYYDVDRVLQTLTCKASPENDKLQDELTTELGPDVVGKITGRRFKSRFKRLVSPIIVPREMYD
jgi:NAD+ synthetase